MPWYGFDLNRYKKLQGKGGAHSSEPQKTHPTREFTIVVENHGPSLLCLVSRLGTVVSEF